MILIAVATSIGELGFSVDRELCEGGPKQLGQ